MLCNAFTDAGLALTGAQGGAVVPRCSRFCCTEAREILRGGRFSGTEAGSCWYQSGDIFLWKGSHLEWQFEAAHKGPVFALSTYPD
eukprot:1431998-Rhodomonas_salina.1